MVPPGDGLGAKGKAVMIHGESQQAHALPCPNHHVEKRTCHSEGHHDGKDPKNESNETDEGPGATSGLRGATTGPQGAESESLSMGLGLEYHWAPLTGTF